MKLAIQNYYLTVDDGKNKAQDLITAINNKTNEMFLFIN